MSTIMPQALLGKSFVETTQEAHQNYRRKFVPASMAALAVFTIIGVGVFFAPPRWDANSGLAASIDKHARLQACKSPKIVFIGGSTVSTSNDTVAVEKALGRDTVNMGMGASMGLRYQLEEVRNDIKAGDLLVIMPEYGNFFSSDKDSSNSHFYGSSELFNVASANPQAYRWICAVYSDSPAALIDGIDNLRRFLVLKSKFYRRILGELLWCPKKLWSPDLLKPTETIFTHRNAYNSHGDFIAHLNLPIPPVKGAEPIAPGDYVKFDTGSADFLNSYEDFAESRGGALVLIPPAFPKNVRCKNAVMNIYEHWKRSLKFPVLGSPDRYGVAWSELFDTPYHLNAEGRSRRTNLVIDDLRKFLETRK
jgi:hypothetical protein